MHNVSPPRTCTLLKLSHREITLMRKIGLHFQLHALFGLELMAAPLLVGLAPKPLGH